MRVAIACSGLGRVRRGFETFAEDLFRRLGGEPIHATLFKGGGVWNANEVVVWNVPRDSPMWGGWRSPLPWHIRYFVEQWTFSSTLARRLRRDDFDILVFSDIQVGHILCRLCRGARMPRLLFSNGGRFSPIHYRDFDHIQLLTPSMYKEAVAQGIEEDKLHLLPYGVDTDRFAPARTSGERLRRSMGIGPEDIVILSVGALETGYKRMDWLIREVAEMETQPHLVICGEYKAGESEAVRALGLQTLGSRFHVLRVPYHEMPCVCNTGDLFVLCSLKEGLSRAMIEALACGIPVVHHKDDDMAWVTGSGGVQVDMLVSGQLSGVLAHLADSDSDRRRLGREAREHALRRFGWRNLIPQYVEMFRQVLNSDAG